VDPDPDVFGLPRSGSVNILSIIGSRSRSFHQQAKKSKKNHDFYYFVTSFDFLSMKTDVNGPSKSNKQKI
jgi:hypothetical protein